MTPMTPERHEEFLATLALRNSTGLGPRTWKKILEHFGRADLAVEQAGQWNDLGLANKNQLRDFLAKSWRETTDQEAEAALNKGMDTLLWSDQDYPSILRQIPNPPALLYLAGDRSLFGSPALAMVGSRKCSRYGLEAVRRISRDVSRAGVCVVSGFAAGIDRQAHAAALEEVGSSIAVLGTGLDLLYPAANKDLWLRLRREGLIVTEFAPGVRPDAVNFPHRNRIISGLSLGVVVIEAAVRSGSLITAATALEQGREVFALPGPVNMESYSGCHHLIRQGATLVQTADDVLAELRPILVARGIADADVPAPLPDSKPSLRPEVSGALSVRRPETASSPGNPGTASDLDRWIGLNKDELRLVMLLDERGKMHIDALCNALGQNPAQVGTNLLLLEMRSLVMQYPGMYYSLCGK